MSWVPTNEIEIRDAISAAQVRMSLAQKRLWEVIKIDPEKWSLSPWGNKGGGFWVVAILGKTVVWYNDIEEGFNLSRYVSYGIINEYWCNQDDLEWTIQRILDNTSQRSNQGDGISPATLATPPDIQFSASGG